MVTIINVICSLNDNDTATIVLIKIQFLVVVHKNQQNQFSMINLHKKGQSSVSGDVFIAAAAVAS